MQVLLTWPITYSANEWGILNGSYARGFHDILLSQFFSVLKYYSFIIGLTEPMIHSRKIHTANHPKIAA